MDSLNRHEDYGQDALDETHWVADPIEQFKTWLRSRKKIRVNLPMAHRVLARFIIC